MIFGKQDTHVPRSGRDLIRATLEDANITVSVSFRYGATVFRNKITQSQFLEVNAQHAFIRDESSKGRWDAALTDSLFHFMMEVFTRTVGRDLGNKIGDSGPVEHVC
jgi:carboxymethylenebutenolidase